MKRAVLLCLLGLTLLLGCQDQPAAPAPTAAPSATPVVIEATKAPQAIALTLAPTFTPAPTATPRPTFTPTPTPEPTPTPTPVPTAFSLALIPDTQALAYSHPEAFPLLRDWIEGHRAAENIIGIIHTGDMVDNGFKDEQWDRFAPLLEAVHDGVFFFPIAGNHDLGAHAQSYYAYLKRPFLDDYPEEQKFEGGKMLYRVLNAGEEQILLLGVGWDAYKSTPAVRWIDQVLSEHEGMPCILVTHGFLLSNGGYLSYLEKLISQRPAIRLVLCSHARDYQTRSFAYDDDGDGVPERSVTALMLNMQDRKDYAFRLLTFDPAAHAIQVRTFRLDGAPAPDLEGLGPISFTLENAY